MYYIPLPSLISSLVLKMYWLVVGVKCIYISQFKVSYKKSVLTKVEAVLSLENMNIIFLLRFSIIRYNY